MTIWANTKLCKKYFVMTVAANMLTNAMGEKNKVYSNRTDNNILSSWNKKKMLSSLKIEADEADVTGIVKSVSPRKLIVEKTL